MTERDATLARRWDIVLGQRERLLRLSRARLRNEQDAEDCVHEAMLRCVESPGLDEARIDRYLTTIVVNLCVDHLRRADRSYRLRRRLAFAAVPEPGPEDLVCDRAEARWVSERIPHQLRGYVHARAEGLSCSAVAQRFHVPYSTVESALSRARQSARRALAG